MNNDSHNNGTFDGVGNVCLHAYLQFSKTAIYYETIKATANCPSACQTNNQKHT